MPCDESECERREQADDPSFRVSAVLSPSVSAHIEEVHAGEDDDDNGAAKIRG
jgi:hypothetical protein